MEWGKCVMDYADVERRRPFGETSSDWSTRNLVTQSEGKVVRNQHLLNSLFIFIETTKQSENYHWYYHYFLSFTLHLLHIKSNWYSIVKKYLRDCGHIEGELSRKCFIEFETIRLEYSSILPPSLNRTYDCPEWIYSIL